MSRRVSLDEAFSPLHGAVEAALETLPLPSILSTDRDTDLEGNAALLSPLASFL